MENRETVYVDCKNWNEFVKFKEQFEGGEEWEFIIDENYLRGRKPGIVKRLGGYKERWNHIAITESIDRMMENNEEYFDKKELEDEIGMTGLSDEDLEYGINE